MHGGDIVATCYSLSEPRAKAPTLGREAVRIEQRCVVVHSAINHSQLQLLQEAGAQEVTRAFVTLYTSVFLFEIKQIRK